MRVLSQLAPAKWFPNENFLRALAQALPYREFVGNKGVEILIQRDCILQPRLKPKHPG